MSTNAGNVVIGPATLSFKRAGDGQFTDVGFTQGGVSIRLPRDYREVEADQCVGVIMMSKIKEQMFVKTKLLEATFNFLSLAWDQDAPAGVSAGVLGSSDASVHELQLLVVGPGPSGKTRTFTLTRCVSVSEAEFAFKREEESAQEVEFQVIKEDGQNGTTLGRFGSVADSGVLSIGVANLEASWNKGTALSSAGSDNLLTTSGQTGAVAWSVVAGGLPAGVSLAAGTGLLSGTPTQQGIFTFTVQAVDSAVPAETATRQIAMTVVE